jgi:hypothetical protein
VLFTYIYTSITYYRRSGEPIPLTKTLNPLPQLLKFLTPKPFNSASALTPLASKTVHGPMQNHFAPTVYAIWRPDITLRMYTGRYLLFISLTKKYEIPKVVVRSIRN